MKEQIHGIQIYQKLGAFHFSFYCGDIQYSFFIRKCGSGMGILTNKLTKETVSISLSDERIVSLLEMIDLYIEHLRNEILMDTSYNDYMKDIKYAVKDINQTKKYYYDILKSNKNGNTHNRPAAAKEGIWNVKLSPEKEKERKNKIRRDKRASKRKEIVKTVKPVKKKLFDWD